MIPNIITIIRIIISFILIPFDPIGNIFKLLYVLGGISDVLDGYLARKMDLESLLGARLDSLSDFIFFSIVVYKIYDIVYIYKYVLEIFVFIVAVRFISIVICKIKFGKIAIMHTVGNKITGMMLYLYLFFMYSNISEIYQYILCLVGICSALEELLIHIKSNELEINRKHIFYK